MKTLIHPSKILCNFWEPKKTSKCLLPMNYNAIKCHSYILERDYLI